MEKLRLISNETPITPAIPLRKNLLKRRVYAFIIDLYAVVFLNKFMAFAWVSTINKFISNLAIANFKTSKLLYSGIEELSLPIVMAGYFFFSYYLNDGRTLGKMFFKLKLCSNNKNTELTLAESLGRSMTYVLYSYFFYLPFLINFVRKDMKSLTDFISQSTVYSEEEIAIMESLEEKENYTNEQIDMFPEDPVSHRISKTA